MKGENIAEDNAHVEHLSEPADPKEAQQASAAEHEATFWQALKTNHKAALWSAAISLTIIMEGYDVGKRASTYCSNFKG